MSCASKNLRRCSQIKCHQRKSETLGITQNKKKLRQTLRRRRGALSKKQQMLASKAIVKQLPASWRWKGRTVAAYWADDGEIDPYFLLKTLQTARKKIFLPFIDPNNRMRFVSFYARSKKNQQALVRGRWGIYHPKLAGRRFIPKQGLQQIFVPLVAFDIDGNRLGRGGGFYDKLLADKPETSLSIGLAHHFQEVKQLPTEPWDVGLDAIITDQSLIKTTQSNDA